MAQTQAQLIDYGTAVASSVPTNGPYLSAANTVAISTNGSQRVTVDSSGNIGIGNVSSGSRLFVTSASNTEIAIDASPGSPILSFLPSGVGEPLIGFKNTMRFGTVTGIGAAGFTERARIDSSGRLLVGTSTARANFFNSNLTAAYQVEGTGATSSVSRGSISVVNNNTDGNQTSYIILGKSNGSALGSNTLVANDTYLGILSFQGADGTELVEGASIYAQVDGTPGANDMPTRLVFSTTADGASSPTERMRIGNDGRVGINAPSNIGAGTLQVRGASANQIGFQDTGTTSFTHQMGSWNTGTGNFAIVHSSGSGVQLIGSSATSWSGFSDTRLKNVSGPITDALNKIKQLEPIAFTWKNDPNNKPCVGISAQSIQPVLPEAIDECTDFGNPNDDTKYLSVRYTDLVPLLTAALQEAIGRIETLEAEVAALKAQ